MPGRVLWGSFGCVGVPILGLVPLRGSKSLSAIVDIPVACPLKCTRNRATELAGNSDLTDRIDTRYDHSIAELVSDAIVVFLRLSPLICANTARLEQL